MGAGVSVDYGSVYGLSVLGYVSTPGGPLPLGLGTTTDTGTRIENVNSASVPPYRGYRPDSRPESPTRDSDVPCRWSRQWLVRDLLGRGWSDK